MTTASTIDNVIDTMIARLQANITLLGGTSSTPVIEGDEDPAAVRTFPSIYVVPLIGDGDSMEQHMNSSALFHTYPVNIIGFYRDVSVAAMLRTVRGYGYTVVDLFSGPVNYKIVGTTGGAVVTDWKVEPMYWRYGNKIVHNFVTKLVLESVTGG